MARIARRVAFVVLELLFAPISLVGLAFYLRIPARCRRAGVSFTAFEPLGARVFFDAVGSRPDAAALRLLYALPTSSRTGVALALAPTLLALRWTGFVPRNAVLPVARPSTPMTMLAHRTGFFDRVLESSLGAVTQVVVLGAGWDTRAYGLLAARSVRVFEVDAPATQRAKRVGLARAGLDASSVTFVPVDFGRERWLERLQEEGFDPAQPTFVLWEGVTYYLEPAAAAETLRQVAHLAAGSRVAFDFFGERVVRGEGPRSLRRAVGFVRRLGEPWRFGLPEEPTLEEALRRFVQAGGLHLDAFEPFGPRDAAFGGLALASVPETSGRGAG